MTNKRQRCSRRWGKSAFPWAIIPMQIISWRPWTFAHVLGRTHRIWHLPNVFPLKMMADSQNNENRQQSGNINKRNENSSYFVGSTGDGQKQVPLLLRRCKCSDSHCWDFTVWLGCNHAINQFAIENELSLKHNWFSSVAWINQCVRQRTVTQRHSLIAEPERVFAFVARFQHTDTTVEARKCLDRPIGHLIARQSIHLISMTTSRFVIIFIDQSCAIKSTHESRNRISCVQGCW